MSISVQPANTNSQQPYHLGLPMWSNRDWLGSLYPAGSDSQTFLQHYSSVFNAVEGNTTFYALPSEQTVSSWALQAQPGFKFCFKLPRSVTHIGRLQSSQQLTDYFKRLEPLGDFLGPFMVQLPADVGGDALSNIKQFLAQLPTAFQFSLEVRSPDFFLKDEVEKRLNQLLIAAGVDRVCFDSRALFSLTAKTAAEKAAQKQKPNLPVHAIATANKPIVRFIGTKDANYNDYYLQSWLPKISQWCAEGRRPYLFVHTPANEVAPYHAQLLHQKLAGLPNWQPLVKTIQAKQQITLF